MSDNKPRFQNIYDHLKTKGVAVYSPEQHKGECTSPYVVIKDAGQVGLSAVSSSQHLFDLMCYVPKEKYSTLDSYVSEIETYMDELFPLVRPVPYRTPSFYDDAVKAHMVSTQYVNYKKNIRR